MKLISVQSRGNRLVRVYGGLTAKTLVWSALCKQFDDKKKRFQAVINRERKTERTVLKAAEEWLEGATV
jgi:hypothetical protein